MGSKKKWTNERIDNVITNRHIKRLTNVQNVQQPSTTPIEWCCMICNYSWKSRVDNVINKNSGCPKCAGNIKLSIEQIQQRLDKRKDQLKVLMVTDGTLHQHRRIKLQCCKCGNEWENLLHNVMSPSHQQGCNYCNRHKGRIGKEWVEKSFPSIFYVVEFYNDLERFVKVGISKQSLNRRFGKKVYRNMKREVLFECTAPSTTTWKWEQELLCKFKQHQFIPQIKNFSGKTECFTFDVKHDIINYCNKLLTETNNEI